MFDQITTASTFLNQHTSISVGRTCHTPIGRPDLLKLQLHQPFWINTPVSVWDEHVILQLEDQMTNLPVLIFSGTNQCACLEKRSSFTRYRLGITQLGSRLFGSTHSDRLYFTHFWHLSAQISTGT